MGKTIQSFWRSAAIHPIVLVVTIREGEVKGICSAAMRELIRIVKDQVGEECAVAMVLSRKSTIWRRAIEKTLLRKKQMKYIDVQEMRVVTNDKHIAEQIKSDSTLSARECLLNRKVESNVMNGVKSKRGDLVKSIVMNGPKVGNFGKSGEGTKFEERRDGRKSKVENLEN